ncbi:MAG: hypothetical protein WC757_02755 [Candidatus Paceibacterota bacterium]|jgi:ABC-type glycerol-3-phosphate transport system substrate-binding protein
MKRFTLIVLVALMLVGSISVSSAETAKPTTQPARATVRKPKILVFAANETYGSWNPASTQINQWMQEQDGLKVISLSTTSSRPGEVIITLIYSSDTASSVSVSNSSSMVESAK